MAILVEGRIPKNQKNYMLLGMSHYNSIFASFGNYTQTTQHNTTQHNKTTLMLQFMSPLLTIFDISYLLLPGTRLIMWLAMLLR